MDLPVGVSEGAVLAAIERVVRVLAPSFVFGYLDADDVRQMGRIFAMEAMSRYDATRPLDNFLYVHVKNRLINAKRDMFRRTDAPCRECQEGRPCRRAEREGERCCEAQRSWARRNDAKASLMRPTGMERVPETLVRTEGCAERDAEYRELLGLIDLAMPAELRAAYLRLREGLSVPRAERAAVAAVCARVMG